MRPIIVPRDITVLQWNTGYAECVNSGKSGWNEDQAAFCRQVLSHPTKQHPDLPYTYFGIFGGHAGYALAALAASHQFHHILHEILVDIIEISKDIKISALSLLKMVMHARSGGTLEVMGLLLGKVEDNTMVCQVFRGIHRFNEFFCRL